MSYLDQRIHQELGIAPDQYTIRLRTVHPDFGHEQQVDVPIFTSDDKDNIEILIYTLDRKKIEYDHADADPEHQNINNNRTQHYHITRLNPDNIKDDMPKYLMPRGKGIYPFLPPALIDKYDAAEPIETLYLTEGAFKAMKASVHGLDIVGFSSITHYADSRTKQMHPAVVQLIDRCKVQNVVMLYDGDCLNISLKDLQLGRDANTRPQGFYSSMLKIFELLKDYDVKIWFAHINSAHLQGEPKGLDDLLVSLRGREHHVIDELKQLDRPGHYTYRLSVAGAFKRMQNYFAIKTPDQFYNTWREVIQDKEWSFHGTKYRYNIKTQKLEKTMPRELKNFMRVGDDYYELVDMPVLYGNADNPTSIEGDTEQRLFRRKKGTITDDFGVNAIKLLPKYKAFVNVPSHTDYQKVISNCYNQYSEIKHDPTPGTCPTILAFIRHIFGEQYELGLDYIEILYKYPKQILPILCLVSQERGTGKTTFIDFLKMIFGENCAKVGNEEITSKFNSFLTSRLIVGVDETALSDRRDVTERIKMLSTSTRIFSQSKGVDHIEQWHFAKYILTSNFETTFIYTQEDEIRFWVRKVPILTHYNHTFLTDIYSEIPAFLHLLEHRKISVPNDSRMWFTPQQLDTDSLRALKERQRDPTEAIIREWARNLFMDFPAQKYYITAQALKWHIPSLQKKEDIYLNAILKDNLHLQRHTIDGKSVTKKFKIPYYTDFQYPESDQEYAHKTHAPGRPFELERAQFLTPQEIADTEHSTPHLHIKT